MVVSANSAIDNNSEKLAALDQYLEELNLEGHWRLTDSVAREPVPFAKPYVWKWHDIRSGLLQAGEIQSINGGSRRTVRLCTPGLGAKWATPTIHASVQMVKPGEIAEAHRHSISALRYVVEGNGGYTTVEGVTLPMEPGDLILTPSLHWHDHGNDGDEPVIWIDGHDVPLLGHLRAQFNELYNAPTQLIRGDEAGSRARAGAVRPSGMRSQAPRTVPYVYKGSDALALLHAMTDEERDPSGSFTVDYVDPISGGYTMPTIACRLHRILRDSGTRSRRATLNSIYAVVQGSGHTETPTGRLSWTKGDIFVVPGWTWNHQVASGMDDVILFEMNDEPVLKAFGLFRSEISGLSQ